jgi:hypothetical protein
VRALREKRVAEIAERDAEIAAERALWEKRVAERDAHIAQLDALANGTYYTTISQLWDVAFRIRFKDENYIHRIARTERKPKKMHHVGEGDDHDPCGATATRLWPRNIFGERKFGDEIAHLVPASPRDADTWWFVVPWLFGGWHGPTDSRWKSWTGIKKAIHGMAESGESRVDHSGIKHFVTNKARIPGHKIYMDNNPCLLIVPIMTTEEVRDWDGGGYEAIVLVDEWTRTYDSGFSVYSPLKEVAKKTDMDIKSDSLASMKEIETARGLLEFFLRAIFTAHGKRPEGAPDDVFNLPIPIDPPRIKVPSSLKPGLEKLRVRKIKFAAHTGDTKFHPAPDPILLASKAAVVFSTRHNQALAAGAEIEDDYEWTDLDELAAEKRRREYYLECRRNNIWEEMDSKLIHTFV